MIDIFYGSSLWAITDDGARFVLDTISHNKTVRKFFSGVFAPDEMWAHTIMANSQYKEKMIFSDSYAFDTVTPLHFVEYRDKIRVWNENDYNYVMKSNKMFVRKVTSKESGKFVKMIDEYRKK